jgi:hypothetical protein
MSELIGHPYHEQGIVIGHHNYVTLNRVDAEVGADAEGSMAVHLESSVSALTRSSRILGQAFITAVL